MARGECFLSSLSPFRPKDHFITWIIIIVKNFGSKSDSRSSLTILFLSRPFTDLRPPFCSISSVAPPDILHWSRSRILSSSNMVTMRSGMGALSLKSIYVILWQYTITALPWTGSGSKSNIPLSNSMSQVKFQIQCEVRRISFV